MKKFILILSFALLLLNPVYAYSEESATTHAHYEHPETGVIEDPGNNPGIGQGMCENVLHETALFEEVNGELYLCVRYNMANNIDNVSFAVQNKGEENFIAVDYELVTSTESTNDYRFKVPSKDIIVRSTFFVGPMGRDVVFYFDFSDFINGNTDFIALGENGSMQNIISSDVVGKGGSTVEIKAVNNLMKAGDLGYEHGLLLRESPEIQAVYGSVLENNDKENSPAEQLENDKVTAASLNENAEWGFVTKTVFQSLMFLFTGIVLILMIVACFIYGYAKHLKNINSIKEEALDEEY